MSSITNIFGFLSDAGNHSERLIDSFKGKDDLAVDTCAVSDSAQPYETGIKHQAYNNGDWVIVELYDTKKEAQAGHDKWVKVMTADLLPDRLVDVSSCGITELLDIFDENSNFRYKPKQT